MQYSLLFLSRHPVDFSHILSVQLLYAADGALVHMAALVGQFFNLPVSQFHAQLGNAHRHMNGTEEILHGFDAFQNLSLIHI